MTQKERPSEAELDALADAQLQAYLDGTLTLEPVYTGTISLVDLAKLRKRMSLTQKAFAETFGFSLGAVRNWEQGRRLPDRSARILLHALEEDPEFIARIAART